MMNQSVTIDVRNAQEQLSASASPLKLWQRRLTILLIAQVLLILGVFAYQENSRVQFDAQFLLAIKSADIDRMVIQDASNKVTLQKNGSQWQLPELHQLPVDKQKLDEILQKLDGTKLTWPVTTTASSHERFEVSGTKFQRRIELFQGDAKKADLWLGSTPGFKKIHLRREGENQVYAVELTAFEFATASNDWLKSDLLAVKDVTSIKASDYELQKNGEAWTFVATTHDANTQKVNATKVTELMNAIGNLQVQEVVAQVPQGETTKLSAKSAAGEFNFEFTKAGGGNFVKRSDRDLYFKLSQTEFERIANVNKGALLASESTSSNTAADPVSNLVNQSMQGILNGEKSN
ncbi:DUF4340 domain-containing protein [Cellvibrio sp. UBA7671]|uniref:DUF4340 domain-containing protein n=1 Tax=Cellvibrio sp. UBA7671 TaxID=1946312 RepID=UPI002F356DC0